MGRETVVLALVAVLIGVAVVRLVRITGQQGAPGFLPQVAFGLGCGTVGAVAAAAPYADVVPDAAEVPLLVALPVVLVGAATLRWWRDDMRARRSRAADRPSPSAILLPDPETDATPSPAEADVAPLPRRRPGTHMVPGVSRRRHKRPPGPDGAALGASR